MSADHQQALCTSPVIYVLLAAFSQKILHHYPNTSNRSPFDWIQRTAHFLNDSNISSDDHRHCDIGPFRVAVNDLVEALRLATLGTMTAEDQMEIDETVALFDILFVVNPNLYVHLAILILFCNVFVRFLKISN